MPQRLGSVAASSAKRLEKKGDKSVDVQFDVLGRDAVVDVEPFCNLGVHSHVFDDWTKFENTYLSKKKVKNSLN